MALDDFISAILDELCQEVAEQAIEMCIEILDSEPVNEGQQSLAWDAMPEYEDQLEDIADGDFEPVETPHPEAIGQMIEECNGICEAAAYICNAIQALDSILAVL